MNKIFLAIGALIILIGVAWFALQQKPVSPSSVPQTSTVDTSSWKTYRNEQYGFEFQYPLDWNLENSGRNIAISPIPKSSRSEIDISVSPVISNDAHLSFDCPITAHQIECSNLENKNTVPYARSISTGQLQNSHQQQLDAFLNTSNADLQMTVLLTDQEGNQLASSPQTVIIFDQILSTFKFVSSTSPVNASNWKTYRNEQYGFEFQYPSDQNLVLNAGPNYNPALVTVEGVSFYYYPSISEMPYNKLNNLQVTSIDELIVKDINREKLGVREVGGLSATEVRVGGEGLSYELLINKNGAIYEIFFEDTKSSAELSQIDNQLLSTFKFTK